MYHLAQLLQVFRHEFSALLTKMRAGGFRRTKDRVES